MGDHLEEAARFYEEDNGGLHFRSDVLVDTGGEETGARNVRVDFIPFRNVLFSVHGRIRPNVMDTRRALGFMMRSRLWNTQQFEQTRRILRDIDSLDSHTAFLFDKINFLMDATVGFININQNKIIKIFSVAAVALLPPTLIASFYGMNFNFRRMPELDWGLGYLFALCLMVVSVITPFWYFRRKGWL